MPLNAVVDRASGQCCFLRSEPVFDGTSRCTEIGKLASLEERAQVGNQFFPFLPFIRSLLVLDRVRGRFVVGPLARERDRYRR